MPIAGGHPERGGVLSRQLLKELESKHVIWSRWTPDESQFQPASLDLRLGERAYRIRSSFLPDPNKRLEQKLADFVMYDVDLRDPAIFEPNATYLVQLMENLRLPPELRARANARSSTGRVDVFTRLVVDGYPQFDEIPSGYSGPLYLEVLSRSHLLKVERGLSLNQIRMFEGRAACDDDEVKEIHTRDKILFAEDGSPIATPHVDDGLWMHAAVSAEDTGFVGYKVKTNTSEVLDLSKRNFHDPIAFWEPVFAEPSGRVILAPGGFYLIFSKEKVRIPPYLAAEMVAYAPTFGELRAHYAGFFDPGFGYGVDGEIAGTRAVLEVRCHDVPFALESGQPICKLKLERLVSRPDIVYGPDLGSAYQYQESALSKCFKPFPKKLIDSMSRRAWHDVAGDQLSLFDDSGQKPKAPGRKGRTSRKIRGEELL